VFIADNIYRGPYTENSPDLIVGYGAGYRASWDSVMGKVTSQILRTTSRLGAATTASIRDWFRAFYFRVTSL